MNPKKENKDLESLVTVSILLLIVVDVVMGMFIAVMIILAVSGC